MAAQIFVYAGVVILFITNLFFAQRIVRAQHPHFGWSKAFSFWLPIMLIVMVLTILMLISAVIVQFFVPTDYAQQWTRDIQLYGATFYGSAAFLPIPIVLVSTFLKSRPAHKNSAIDNFGLTGSMTSKILIVLFTSTLLSLGAWYRAGTSLLPPTPTRSAQPWYFSKACFYTFNFGIEIFVTLFFFFIRIDRRYIIPDSANGPFSYRDGSVITGKEDDGEKRRDSQRPLVAFSNRTSAAVSHANYLSRPGSWSDAEKGQGHSTPASLKGGKLGHVSWGGRTLTSSENNLNDIERPIYEEILEIDCDMPEQDDARDFERDPEDLRTPPDVLGAEHELGYNARTGRWESRGIVRDLSQSALEVEE